MAAAPKHHGLRDGALAGRGVRSKKSRKFSGRTEGEGGQKRLPLLFQTFSSGILFS